jgi:hypothetical protein
LLCSTIPLAACGSVASRSDAPVVIDAEIPGIDAGPAPVTVTVYDEGTPEVGVDVVFYDGEGNVLDQRLTGGDGSASSVVPEGGSVIVLQIDEFGRRVASVTADVAPGDDLIVGSRAGAFVSEQVGTITINWPSGAVPAGTAQLQIELGCSTTGYGDTATPAVVAIYDYCLSQGSDVTVVATALDNAFVPLAYSVQPDVALTGSPLTATTTLGAWRTDFATLSLTATNTPAGVSVVNPEFQLYANGQNYYVDSPPGAMPTPGGSATFDISFAKNFAEAGQYGVFLAHGDPGMPNGVQIWLTRTSSIPASATVDLTADLLPNVSVAQATMMAGRPVFEWSSDAPQTEADGLYMQFFWSDGSVEHRTLVLASPGSQPPYEVPALPAALSAWQPPASAMLGAQVVYVELDNVSDFDALRTGYGVSLLNSELPPDDYVIRASLGGLFD